MTARIYRPAKTAMQSGKAKTRDWQLDYDPEEPRQIESLMGWTSSADMKQQLRLQFASKEEAKWADKVVRLLPPRRRPRLRTTLPRRSYPCGYSIDELGPAPQR